MELYTRIFSQDCFDVNNVIAKKYQNLNDNDFKEKTHLFNGRYENIYLELDKIPEIGTVFQQALENAALILNIKKERLSAGFWLNEMNAGDVTTAHTHDDDDELLSCVYYVVVPDKSGDLIIYDNKKKNSIAPKEGEFIFFSPSTLHEVSKNESEYVRLSIAFNFGLKKNAL